MSKIEQTFRASRGTLIAVFALTVVNLVLSIMNSDLHFLFSANLSLIALYSNSAWDWVTGDYVFSTVGIALAFLAALPYLALWFASAKNKMWIAVGLGYFVIDIIVFAVLLGRAWGAFETDISFIIELVFLGWILVSLVLGTKAWLDSKKLPPSEPPTPPQNHM